MSELETVVVLFGSGTYISELQSNSTINNVVDYIDNLLNSSWSKVLVQYTANGQVFVGGLKTIGPVTVNALPSNNVSQASIESQLISFIQSGEALIHIHCDSLLIDSVI